MMTNCTSHSNAVSNALRGRCPKCGQAPLFAGLTSFRGRCQSCGLDFDGFNVGDGPAAFLTLILGSIVVGLALWLEFAAEPPFWVHLLLWPPALVALTIWSLRASKAVLLALEFRNDAHEGRL